ncbi:hypothetical protein SCUP234_11464 [Seiridium cupressi]
MASTIRVATTPRPGPAPQKRSGDTLNDRAAKRRSPRACLSCRSRKVRCDVVNCGVPCTNCRLDDVECVLKESSRGRKPYNANTLPAVSETSPQSAAPLQQQATPPSTENAGDYLIPSLAAVICACRTPIDPTLPSPGADQNSGSQSGDAGDDSQDDRSHDGRDDGQDPDMDPLQPPDQYADALGEPSSSSISPQRSQTSVGHANQNRVPSSAGGGEERAHGSLPTLLPPYIRPPPRHIGHSDINYLMEKDALTIPDDEFRDELLRTYVKIIHCFMPAIDLDKLLLPIIRADGQERVSLLLFQAVMFASVIFVDSDLLRSRNFVSRKAARKVFFNRVRLLYGLDYEPDRLALIQALLLMTYWYDSPDDEKDTWYWMGVTLSLSQVLGIHRDPETLNISLREKRLRRRIWWSCYTRDRLLALGVRRPARIREEDFNVPILELDDFDLGQPAPELIAFVRECGFTTPEADRRRAMCQICIELSKLCICIGNILHSQYSVVNNLPFSSEYYKNHAVIPRHSEKQASELAKCDSELEDWYRNQKAACRYAPPSQSSASSLVENGSSDWADKVTWLHQALLRMIYLTAIGALHRPRALDSSFAKSDSPDNSAARESSTRKVKDAALAITKLAFDLQSENYLRYLSTSSVPAFLSATLIHLLDVRNGDEEVRNLAIGRFYQCFHALHELQNMYASADYAVRFLGTVLKRMDADIPMLKTLRLCASNLGDGFGNSASLDTRHATKKSSYENHNISFANQHDGSPLSISNRMTMPAPTMAPPFSNNNNNNTYSGINNDYLSDGPRATPGMESAALLGNGSIMHPSADYPMANTVYMDIWNEMDGILPALINFDVDTNAETLNHEPSVSGTAWQSYM